MGWLTKKLYSAGPGSPGVTGKTIASSFNTYVTLNGYTPNEACFSIIDEYNAVFSSKGHLLPFELISMVKQNINGCPALTAFSIVLLSHIKKQNLIEAIIKDFDLIVEIIVNKQNSVLNHDYKIQLDDELKMKFRLILQAIITY